MRTYFPRRWYLVCLAIVLGSIFGANFPNPDTAGASNDSRRGRKVSKVNYGSSATIGTSQPNIQGSTRNWASFEFIQSRSETQTNRFVQTGWSRQDFCGPSTSVFWEYYNPSITNPYRNGCNKYFPSYDKDYYQEYNPATSYWCNGYEGIVLNCASVSGSSGTGFATASHVVAYGETNHWSSESQIVMGNVGQSNAVWITNIKYKLYQPNPGQWNYITNDGGIAYGSCGYTPCPYGVGHGFAATVLYTFNWTY